MSAIADRLIADAEARCDGAFGEAAGFLAGKLFDILSEQAPLVVVGGRIYAAVNAEPGAPPRRVTGNLQAHVGFERRGPADWVAGVRATVPYALTLERELNHAFFSVVMDQYAGDIHALVANRLGGGG